MMKTKDRRQRLITSALTILVFLLSYPTMIAVAGYIFDEALFPLSKGAALGLVASGLIVVVRDQLLSEEPSISGRLRTVVEVSVIATVISLV